MQNKLFPRKAPKQKRSQERFQKILDVTFDVLSEIGYENLTTDIIAVRSGISLGSLYQFFPNKETIVYTQAELTYISLHDAFFEKIRYLIKKFKKYDSNLTKEILEAFETSLSENKGYPLVQTIVYSNPFLMELDFKSNERFAKSLVKELLLPLFPKLNKQRVLVVAKITVEAVDGVYRSLMREPNLSKSHKKAMIQELNIFLDIYFRSLK